MNQKNIEQQGIERLCQAQKKCRDARSVLGNQFAPKGSGALTKESMDNIDSAEAELHAAQTNITRIAQAL